MGAKILLTQNLALALENRSKLLSLIQNLSMPELPEVETIVRGLRGPLVGRKIIHTKLIGSPTFRQKIPAFLPKIKNVVISNISRHGKSIFIDLTSPDGSHQVLNIHISCIL